MSEGEALVTFVSIAVGLAANIGWLIALRQAHALGRSRPLVGTLTALPFAAAGALWLLLATFADAAVRDSPEYQFMYTAMGMAWVGLTVRLAAWFGLSVRDDVGERRNRSAAVVLGAAYLAIVLCFTGGNFGDGPGWWVVVFCAGLSTATLFGLWALVQAVTGLADRIALDRDGSAAVRFAGLLIASGLILGRAVAGDWESATRTVLDFARIAPAALFLAIVECVVSRFVARSAQATASVDTGWFFALAYLGYGAFTIYQLGPW